MTKGLCRPAQCRTFLSACDLAFCGRTFNVCICYYIFMLCVRHFQWMIRGLNILGLRLHLGFLCAKLSADTDRASRWHRYFMRGKLNIHSVDLVLVVVRSDDVIKRPKNRLFSHRGHAGSAIHSSGKSRRRRLLQRRKGTRQRLIERSDHVLARVSYYLSLSSPWQNSLIRSPLRRVLLLCFLNISFSALSLFRSIEIIRLFYLWSALQNENKN